MGAQMQVLGLQGFPLVEPGDNLEKLLWRSLQDNGLELQDGDVLVVAQKIISKAEGRYVRLDQVEVSERARQLALEADKEPAQVEMILRESREVLRVRPGAIIVEHRLGYVHANAGIDRSNIPAGDEQLLLLPQDPDASAAQILAALQQRSPVRLAVIVNDSAGRAWRNGTIGFALATAGIKPVSDQVGDPDLYQRKLEVTEVAVADELASAASVVMGQAAEACPVVLIRGARWEDSEENSAALLRDRKLDMFR